MALIKYALFLCVFVAGCKEDISVRVTNNSSVALKDVVLNYRGGMSSLSNLTCNTSWTAHIKPSSESSIVLSYFDGIRKHAEDLDIYLEPSCNSFVHIVVQSNGEARVEQIR